jgi:hypothetical protein
MFCSKIKFEIDINNDELLENILKHVREIKRGERGGIIKLNKPPSLLPLFLPLSHIFKLKLQLQFKDVFNY